MRRKKIYITLMILFAWVGTAGAQDYFDDIYYNPKKDKATTVLTPKTEKVSYYIDNMGDMDVDTYNRRGQYYVSQIDTIGSRAENGEDFVYTQQIQKFYNPTIVVDNAAALGDVLANAHGNVEIVINNNGNPVFAPWYGWNWPYYSSVWSPWSWSWNIGPWGWSVGWYDPWYAWGWGPSWWNPGPGWGWGPVWGPGPGPVPGPPMAWRPVGNRTVGPRPGWSLATQPGRNPALNRNPGNVIAGHRPTGVRPGSTATPSRPSGVVNNNGRWEYNTTNSTGHRVAGTGVVSNNRNTTQTTTKRTPTNNNRNTTTNNSNYRNNNSTNRSYSPSRSTNNSFGGGHSTGGSRSTGGRGGGGRHR